jgi:hypothetical protein
VQQNIPFGSGAHFTPRHAEIQHAISVRPRKYEMSRLLAIDLRFDLLQDFIRHNDLSSLSALCLTRSESN